MGSHPVEPDAGSGAAVDFTEVQQTEQFKELRKRHRSFVFPMAVFFLLWYFAYVLLADYAHEFMATPVFGNINVALVFGLLQFVTTFLLAYVYSGFSNRKLDPLARQLDAEYRKGGDA